MRALFGSLGWRDLIAQTEAHPDVMLQEDGGRGPEAQHISANLYLFLSMKVKGKGAAIVRLVADGCGLESWRKLVLEYQPDGAEPYHAMLTGIVQPRWWAQQGHRERAFTDVLLDWENMIARYQKGSGEVISDSLRCATVLGYAPKDTEVHLRAAPTDIRRRRPAMRASIWEYMLGHRAADSYAP